jgi:3-oxoacyl-[acyl-carrier protein] reductase
LTYLWGGALQGITFLKIKKIDIFVHCAGVNNPTPFLELEQSNIEKTLNTNVLSCVKIVKNILPYMIKNKFGRIVNVSSLWSILSVPDRMAYSLSKAALDSLTRNLAVEFGGNGILVNSVLPGFVDTSLTRRNLSNKKIQEIINKTPIKKLIPSEDIANLVYFLGSDSNNAITGQSVVIDGGISITR